MRLSSVLLPGLGVSRNSHSFDDDDGEGGAHEYEDERLSKEIIQEVEYYQADPVMDSLSVFFCCAGLENEKTSGT